MLLLVEFTHKDALDTSDYRLQQKHYWFLWYTISRRVLEYFHSHIKLILQTSYVLCMQVIHKPDILLPKLFAHKHSIEYCTGHDDAGNYWLNMSEKK